MDYAGFVGPTYTSRSRVLSAEECINWYVENVAAGATGKSRMALMPTPGFELFATASVSPNRGMFHIDGRAFLVVAHKFYEISSDGTLTERGEVASDTLPATISSSGDIGNELFITSGGFGYIYNLSTDAWSGAIAGLTAHVGGYLDGFFLALNTDDSILRISEYADGLTWDVLQYRARQSAPDKWKSMLVVGNREIWLLGSETGEVWNNAGTAPFPFRPIQGVFFRQGIPTSFAASPIGDSIAWLAQNTEGQGQIMLAEQYSPRKISNFAVEYTIQKYIRDGIDLSDALSMSYQQDGHQFYVLTFPSTETWVFDLSTGLWHKRGFWNTGSTTVSRFDAYRPGFHMAAFGKHLVGDRLTGKIYVMSPEVYTDVESGYIRRLRRAPCISAEKRQIRHHSLELDMDIGVGLATGQGSDPMMMMRYSDDGGMTFGNELMTSFGAQGKYKTRVDWLRLGTARDRVYEVSCSEPVQVSIVAAYINPSVGVH